MVGPDDEDDAAPELVFDWETVDAQLRRGDDATSADPRAAARRASLPEPGDLIADRYLVEAPLGRGGMGAVFRARDQRLDRPVALKLLTTATNPAAARFAREAEVAANAGVRGVVAVHDHGEHLGAPFLVMELVEGQSLEALLRLGPLDPPEAARLTGEIARTLAALHQRGIVHRDIKPSNVLIGDDGHPRLADFGLARRDLDERLTRTGELVGTPLYMAPELVAGRPTNEQLADIYALGCIVYQAVTGALPIEARTFSELIARYARGDAPPPPSSRRPSLPAGWDVVCGRALAFDPAQRYPTAEALAHDLHLLATGGEVRPPAPRSGRRRPALAAALVLLVIGAATWVRAVGRARDALASFEAWDRSVLAERELGPGAAPLDEAAFGRWEAELEARDGVLLPTAERVALGRARARVALFRRLLDHRAGRHDACERTSGGQDADALAVDALLLVEHGQATQALARARAAVEADPVSARALEALDLVLAARADQAPLRTAAAALAELAGGADPSLASRPRSAQALERAARRWVDEALLGPDPAARLLRLGADFAAAGPRAREALARAKVAAAEERAPAWAAAAAAGDAEAIDLLATLVRAEPPVRPGPALVAELDRVTAEAIAAWEATGDLDQAERALELESRLWYEVGHAHRGAPPPLELVLTLLEARFANRMIAREPSFILLGALRVCPVFVDREAIRHAQTATLLLKAREDRPFIARLAERAPAQSVEWALAVMDADARARPAQRLARLQRVLEARPADLHPERLGELHEELAQARLELEDADSLARALEHAERALALARDPERIEAASLLLAQAHARRRAPARALEALEGGLAQLRTATAAPATSVDAQSSHLNVLARHAARLALELKEVDRDRALGLALEIADLAAASPARLFVFEQEAALAERVAALLEHAGYAAQAGRLRRSR